uniref:non-specific serine/threonine protein kinase n=1 Tax=Globodera rostochiensis TaxID=31243 RepID=A0A914I7L1_GLORO
MNNNENEFPSSSGEAPPSYCPQPTFSASSTSIQNGDIPTQQFVASSASALLNSLVVTPADIVKMRLPNQSRHCAEGECFLFSNEEVFMEKPPKIIEEYLFGDVIGEGSYSKVKEVIHVRTLVRRAVKIIKDKRLRKIPGGDQNVHREIDVLRRLDHRNVVKVVDIFRVETKQKLYIVMEFCVCSLQQMLHNCPEKMLPEFQAHLYFKQLIDGLDFLHTKRIIHKDIKPGNLLLSLDGILKICDLGVAELMESVGDWCTLVQGTPKFQPPEVVSGTQKRFRGRLVDIWACGVTLYNLVSGCYPFDGDVIMKLFENITTAPLQMPPTHISAPLEQLLVGVLQKEPEKRWDTLKIRTSKWFTAVHHIDSARIVRVPPIKDIPAHHPLGIYDALHQLYGQQVDDEQMQQEVDEAAAGQQQWLTNGANGERQQMQLQKQQQLMQSKQQQPGLNGGSDGKHWNRLLEADGNAVMRRMDLLDNNYDSDDDDEFELQPILITTPTASAAPQHNNGRRGLGAVPADSCSKKEAQDVQQQKHPTVVAAASLAITHRERRKMWQRRCCSTSPLCFALISVAVVIFVSAVVAIVVFVVPAVQKP